MTSTAQTGPGNKRKIGRWLWPRQHDPWWFADKSKAELKADLLSGSEARAAETLEYAREVAAAARDRADAAERRAATLSGALAIAVSFTISGAALVIDEDKIPQRSWRVVFAALLLLVALSFVLAALHALRASVGFRKWAWPRAASVVSLQDETPAEERAERAAELLKDFGYNWEVAWAKLRSLDRALFFLILGLFILMALASAFVAYAAVG